MKVIGQSFGVPLVAALSFLGLGCGGGGQSPKDGGAEKPGQGGVRQSCYANGTCNAGLTCLSDVCVDARTDVGSGGAAGAAGAGTAGAGAGGHAGAGGAAGSGMAGASGGAGAGGTGIGGGSAGAGGAGASAGASGIAGAAGGGAGAGGSAVGGNTFCFPTPAGVPGESGLPDWWLGTAPFDDPRWAGSFESSYGTLGNGALNALVDRTGQPAALVLRWRVTTDTSPAVVTNEAWVGLFNTTTGTATVLRLTNEVDANTTAGTVATGALGIAALQKTASATGWSSVAVPSAIANEARLDAVCTTDQLPVICSTWAIRLRVPMTAAAGGLDLGDTFKMWSELDVQGDTAIVADKWPIGAAQVDPSALPLTFPAPQGSSSPGSAPWSDVSANGGTCAPGISLQPGDITVSNLIATGTTIDVAGANTFHVKPLNQTAAVYAPGAIQASLRIADWRAGVGDSPLWLPFPDASCASAVSTASGSVGTGQRFDLICTWTPTAAQTCDYRPDLAPGCTPDTIGARYTQQAISVELSSIVVPVPFSSSSAAATFAFGTH